MTRHPLAAAAEHVPAAFPRSLKALRCDGLTIVAARGFTLFEVIVAVVLLAALASLTLPMLLNRSRSIEFDEVLRQIEGVASSARSEALRGSEPLLFEARWNEQDGAWWIGTSRILSEHEDTEGGSAALVDAARALRDDVNADTRWAADESAQLPAFEAMLSLPRGWVVTREVPATMLEAVFAEAGEATEWAAAAFDVGSEEMEPARREVLGMYMPDGSLLWSATMYLTVDNGRIATFEPVEWLGRLSLREVNAADFEAQSEADEEQAMNEAGEDENSMPGFGDIDDADVARRPATPPSRPGRQP